MLDMTVAHEFTLLGTTALIAFSAIVIWQRRLNKFGRVDLVRTLAKLPP